jgi:hypothetical protein
LISKQIFSWQNAFYGLDSRLKIDARRLMLPGNGKAAGVGRPGTCCQFIRRIAPHSGVFPKGKFSTAS